MTSVSSVILSVQCYTLQHSVPCSTWSMCSTHWCWIITDYSSRSVKCSSLHSSLFLEKSPKYLHNRSQCRPNISDKLCCVMVIKISSCTLFLFYTIHKPCAVHVHRSSVTFRWRQGWGLNSCVSYSLKVVMQYVKISLLRNMIKIMLTRMSHSLNIWGRRDLSANEATVFLCLNNYTV